MTSVWNGLSGGQPMEAATSLAKTVCTTRLNMPIAPDTPRTCKRTISDRRDPSRGPTVRRCIAAGRMMARIQT